MPSDQLWKPAVESAGAQPWVPGRWKPLAAHTDIRAGALHGEGCGRPHCVMLTSPASLKRAGKRGTGAWRELPSGPPAAGGPADSLTRALFLKEKEGTCRLALLVPLGSCWVNFTAKSCARSRKQTRASELRARL